jgi:hypothetical protein
MGIWGEDDVRGHMRIAHLVYPWGTWLGRWTRPGPITLEEIMTVTDNHTVKFKRTQLEAVGELIEWFTTFGRSRLHLGDLDEKKQSLKDAKSIIDYSLNNPDFKF